MNFLSSLPAIPTFDERRRSPRPSWTDDRRDIFLCEIMEASVNEPKRPAHRPGPTEYELKRRRLAAWLVDSGTLSREDVECLVDRRKRTINLWRALNAKAQ